MPAVRGGTHACHDGRRDPPEPCAPRRRGRRARRRQLAAAAASISFSEMSKLAQTFCTSSLSSRASISFSICWALAPSRVMLFSAYLPICASSGSMPAFLIACQHRLVGVGRSVDLADVAGGLDVVRARLEGEVHQLLFVDLVRGDGDVAAGLEHVGHAAGGAQVAAVLGEDVADLGDGAVAVVGRAFDQDGHPARAVALEGDLLVGGPLQLARALLDGALDVVGGHVHALGLVHRRAQAGVARPSHRRRCGPRSSSRG